MKMAATRAIAACVTDEELGLGVIVPSMFQPRVHEQVAAAVAEAWASEHPAAAVDQATSFTTWTEPPIGG